MSPYSGPSRMLQVVDFFALTKRSCELCPVNHLLIISCISQSAAVTPVSTIPIQNSITIQRQCVCAPSAIKDNSGTRACYVTITCCTVANLWRQHELSVASTCFVCWFHQFFRRLYLKVPTNTVEKHVLWHLSTPLIGNLGLQECRMHLRLKVSSIIHGICKNYRTRTSSLSKMVKQDHSCTHIKGLIICSTSVPEICYFNSTLHFEQSAY